MPNHNPNNERIKRRYFAFLKEAKRQAEPTIDGVAMAIARFEEYTGHRDFKAFHVEQAVGFKKHLARQDSKKHDGKLSKATLYSTFASLKRFFQWLSGEPGYRSKLTYSDAEYFNLSEKETRIATARRPRPIPTLEQARHVLAAMPGNSEVERRDRAVVAFALLTGARDGAITSAKLKHVDLGAGGFFQDARDVRTKFSKTFTTFFFPVGNDAREIVYDWITYLRGELKWGNEAPVFPATKMGLGLTGQFQPVGLEDRHWSNATPIRSIFRSAFESAGLPYFNPHSFRSLLTRLGEERCSTPEEFKAWSQNLGHEGVLTTFSSYGYVDARRQGQIVSRLEMTGPKQTSSNQQLAEDVARLLAERGFAMRQGSN